MIAFWLSSSVLIRDNIDMKRIKAITLPCIQEGIEGSGRKGTRKHFLRRMITAELPSSYPRKVWDWCLEYTSDYVNLSTDVDRKEGVAAPLVTYCKRLVCSSLRWKKKTLMVSKSLFTHISSAEECTHITKLWEKWFKTWEERKIC